MSVCAIGCQQLFFLVCSMTRAVERLNERELQQGAGKSWHDDYKDSAYIFIGNLDYMLTEGDVLTVFSQCVFLVPPPLFFPLSLSFASFVFCAHRQFFIVFAGTGNQQTSTWSATRYALHANLLLVLAWPCALIRMSNAAVLFTPVLCFVRTLAKAKGIAFLGTRISEAQFLQLTISMASQ